jgi:hypothetical protein
MKKDKHFFVEDDILAGKSLRGDFDKKMINLDESLFDGYL